MDEHYERMIKILERSPIFGDLSEERRDKVLAGGSVVVVERRRPLAPRRNEEALYVIGRGRLRVFVRDGDREITLSYRGPGELLGEYALLGLGAIPENIAADKVEALRLPPQPIQAILSRDNRILRRLTEHMARTRAESEDRVRALLTRTVESRVAVFLLRAAEKHGVPDSRGTLIGVKYTHLELANYVGSTRETVTLVLGQLRRNGIIDMDHRRVVVLDQQALELLV
ncbi:MAG: Crp/Fnr family transcriptional regulator [Deltaproteobacteria bacterium]|nr:Crp/Fnr family transcriptional regulator [Deltaproteobacteria bacterium]